MKNAIQDIESLGLTKQRQTVLRVIRETDKHLTANEVFENARQLMSGISFATVYNSLRYLKNEGLIGEIQFGLAANRYDRNLTQHDHAICNNCGKMTDLKLPLQTELFTAVTELSAFNIESVELTLRGQCSDCSK
jgi:Fur family peroxide stress response transcriptional regulator